MKYIKNLLLALLFVPLVVTAFPIIPRQKDEWSEHSTIILIGNIKHLLKCLLFIILIAIYFTIRYITS